MRVVFTAFGVGSYHTKPSYIFEIVSKNHFAMAISQHYTSKRKCEQGLYTLLRGLGLSERKIKELKKEYPKGW